MFKQMTKCFVGGVSGAGKTTLLTDLHRRSNDCEVIRGSRLMFAALGLSNGDYAALRALPAALKDRVFCDVIRPLLDRAETAGRSVLIDGHFLNFSNGTPRPVVLDWVGRMDLLVLIDTDATTIWGRIKSDKMRADRNAEFHNLNQHLLAIQTSLEQTRAEAKRLSIKYRKPLRTIDNSSGLGSAVEMLSQVVSVRLEDQMMPEPVPAPARPRQSRSPILQP
jgi:adenylate kinase